MAVAEKDNIQIRECSSLDELARCVDLQREVFQLPEIEISPVRQFVVTKNAGGFVLGAFAADQLVGFVLSVPAFLRGERAFYSHMTAVRKEFQSFGIGGRLKWAQRERSLADGVKIIKWTFEPVKARNAFFNLEKLGASVRDYQENFYGTDYTTAHKEGGKIGLASDRLFAEWHLESDKVNALASGEKFLEAREPRMRIGIPDNWSSIVEADPAAALSLQLRVRGEFQSAIASGLVADGFVRDANDPHYLLYNKE
jgi:predicted GNAT superfamily acetyltransferase